MRSPSHFRSVDNLKPQVWAAILLCYFSFLASAFSPSSVQFSRSSFRSTDDVSRLLLGAASSADDVCTVQILMSDTGGGHRASANALRDAFDVLYPGKFECDIVDIYTDYGPFWPFNGYVEGYKLMAKYSFLWDGFYQFGETDLGLWINDLLLSTFCFEPFKKCLNRPSGTTKQRADMVVSVHPLCQDLPLKILSDLDSNGKSRDPSSHTTPFVTVSKGKLVCSKKTTYLTISLLSPLALPISFQVVTDLGGAHKTWFNPKYVLHVVGFQLFFM